MPNASWTASGLRVRDDPCDLVSYEIGGSRRPALGDIWTAESDGCVTEPLLLFGTRNPATVSKSEARAATNADVGVTLSSLRALTSQSCLAPHRDLGSVQDGGDVGASHAA